MAKVKTARQLAEDVYYECITIYTADGTDADDVKDIIDTIEKAILKYSPPTPVKCENDNGFKEHK